jgi:hypothetical protein
MERNTELLERTMQQIMDHPELHAQYTWVGETTECGTAMCFAGWACVLHGYKVEARAQGTWIYDRNQTVPIPATARRLLGLTGMEASTLFDGNNTRPMLQAMVKDLVNGDALRDLDHYQENYR